MATASQRMSKKSRSHRDVPSDRTTNNPTVDELRDARMAYFSNSPNERVQRNTSLHDSDTKQTRHRHKHETSRDTGRGDKTAEQHKKNTDPTAESTSRRHVEEDSSGEFVYKARRTSERDRGSRSNVDQDHTIHSLNKSHGRSSRVRRRRSYVDVSQPRSSARHRAHQSVSTSQADKTATTPTSRRRDTISATTSKDDDKRKSVLGSWFKTTTVPAVNPRARTAECLTCGSDDVPVTRSAKLKCGHRMCNSCLKRIFTMSVNDPSHMPPRCCTDEHIPLKYVDDLFDLKFKVLWNKKYEEYTTKNRLYCPRPGCGTWIKPSQIHSDRGSKYGVCGKCKAKVCTICNGKHRPGKCPKDPEIEKFLATAQKEGWQRCPNCKAMVELKEGCHHITCRCTAEWCFLCRKKWRTCECPWFSYTEVADGDRLNHMRNPAIIPLMQQFFGEAGQAPLPILPEEQHRRRARNARNPALQYQEEADARRRQMARDEAFARQLQLIAERDDVPPPHRNVQQEVFGNAGEHFLNNNFVQESPIVDTAVLADSAFGQRGERASGRRKPPNVANFGPLGPNAFGTDSVLGMGPPPPSQAPERSGTVRTPSDKSSKQGGGATLGRWLSRLG